MPRNPAFEFPGWMTAEELDWLYALGRTLDGQFFEIGSYQGRSAAAILQGIVDGNCNAALTCVDAFVPSEFFGQTYGQPDVDVLGRNLDLINEARWNVYGIPSLDAAEYVQEESLAGVFIDADHSYSEVAADIRAWGSKVRKGGILAGHDYSGNWPDVVRAVDELLGPVEHVGAIWWTRK